MQRLDRARNALCAVSAGVNSPADLVYWYRTSAKALSDAAKDSRKDWSELLGYVYFLDDLISIRMIKSGYAYKSVLHFTSRKMAEAFGNYGDH